MGADGTKAQHQGMAWLCYVHLAIESFMNKVPGKGSVIYQEWLRCPGDTSSICQHPTMLQLLSVASQPQPSPISNKKLNHIHTVGILAQMTWPHLRQCLMYQQGHVGDERYQEGLMRQEVGQVFCHGPKTAVGGYLSCIFQTISSLGLRPSSALACPGFVC